MTLKPHPYQEKALAFSKSRVCSYQALDMGLGKTLIALQWSKERLGSTLVIAPLSGVDITWPDEILKWVPDQSFTILHGPEKLERLLGPTKKYYIINYDGLPWLFKNLVEIFKAKKPMPFRSMIIDEGSMLKSHRTKRFKVMKQVKDLCNQGIMILSGTPAPNALLNLWSQYYILDGGQRLGKTYGAFQDEFFTQKDMAGRVHPFRWFLKSPEHADMIYKRIEDITYRLDGDDYLNLPEITYNTIPIVLPKEHMVQYKILKKKAIVELEENTVAATFAAALSMKLRQFVQGAMYIDDKGNYEKVHEEKVRALKELMEESDGQGILCAIQFKFEVDMIRKYFPDAPLIAGKRKGEEQADKVETIRKWNRGEIPLLLCHPASLSHSVNMQYGSHLLLWYSIPWSLEQYLQLNKRLHRQGQKNAVIIHHLVARGTIDELIMKALLDKNTSQQALLDYLKELRQDEY